MAGLEDAHTEAEDDDLADEDLVEAGGEGGEQQAEAQGQGAEEGAQARRVTRGGE